MKNVAILMYTKGRLNTKGESLIYLRITVDGQRKETSLNRSCVPNKWDRSKMKVKGTTEEVRILNEFLDSEKNRLYKLKQELVQNDVKITVDLLMKKYMGVEEKQHTLVEVFENENKRIKTIREPGTYKKYTALISQVKSFLEYKYKISDIEIREIDPQFIDDFDFYLRTVKFNANNITVKKIGVLHSIVKIALNYGWITKDPFVFYKGKLEKVETGYLTMLEIKTIYKKAFSIERLEQVRDVFIFCCYTGLAYADVQRLNSDSIEIGIDGNKWIKINRKKTNTVSNFPILPVAQDILDKYKDWRVESKSLLLLPVPSNQKMNAYLKEIGDLCGIVRPLTSHLARHSFATSVALTNGLPIETLSDIMGHSNLNITRHYGKTVKLKTASDMSALKLNLAKNEAKSSPDTALQVI